MDADLRSFVKKLDHVAIAVHSIRDALPLYRDALAGEYYNGGTEHANGFRWVQFIYPDGGKLELLEPVGENSFLYRFLAKRGEGLHHITYMVENIEQVVVDLKDAGYRVVDENYHDPEWQEAFISPKSAHGTVVQVAETCLSEAEKMEKWRPDFEALLRSEA